jgi:hypothetical protein
MIVLTGNEKGLILYGEIVASEYAIEFEVHEIAPLLELLALTSFVLHADFLHDSP